MVVNLSISEKTICLNMIVKNESHIILNTLENLCSYITFAYWVISDTGSTDDTKSIITDFFKQKNIPGELVEHEWKDFGYNRTKALECAYNKSDYIFIFDADDKIFGEFKLPNIYEVDRYQVKFGPHVAYTRPLLVTNRKKWCFTGVLHESLSNIDVMNGEKTLEGEYYVESGRTGNRSKNPTKYLDDAIVLKNAFNCTLASDYGLACRYAFYCGQSYKDAGPQYMDDAIEWYKKCLDLGNWAQEKYYACLMIGNLYKIKNDIPNTMKYWYKTVEYDIERMEGVVWAMKQLMADGQNLVVNALYHKFKDYKKNPQQKLFIFENDYNDEIEYHNSVCAFYVNDKESGYECCKKIILNNVISYGYLKSTLSNTLFYKDLLEKDTATIDMFYSVDNALHKISSLYKEQLDPKMVELWTLLFEKNRKKLTLYNNFSFMERAVASAEVSDWNTDVSEVNRSVPPRRLPKIFLSFTTCKRFDLFKQTVNSILNHWTDIDKVDYWFCVDDNSSEEDRVKMTTSYPWINYRMKTPEEKGHRQSMNIIWDKLKELGPVYWIHMEDDFLFHTKMNYVGEAISALTQLKDEKVCQILFNRNYGETIEDYKVLGHTSSNTNSNIVVHNYKLGTFSYSNCHYWPHYSFRPAVINVKTVLELGNFDSTNQFFEMDYAIKWYAAGYKSGFFNRITNRHIGRLTSERHLNTVKNAYDLNDVSQFQQTTTSNVIKEIVHVPEIVTLKNNSIKIINLERRPDRKEATIQKMQEAGIDKTIYEFVKAVDGLQLQPTLELKQIFERNDFGSRKCVIGCALSHLNLWKQLLTDESHNYYIIMEDDFSLSPHFKTKMSTLESDFISKEVVFIGYHMFEKNRVTHSHIYNNCDTDLMKVESLNKSIYIGGYFAYSINKQGAQILVDYISTHGCKHGIDYSNKIMNNLQSYECQPQLTFSLWNEAGAKIDTDIQTNYDFLDFSLIKDDNVNTEDTEDNRRSLNNIYINGIGGLGNNLYQIAVAIYYKETYKNCNIILNKNDDWLNFGSGNKFGKNRLKTSYLNTILNKFNTIDIVPPGDTLLYNDCFSLNKLDLSNVTNKNIIIDGYSQNVDLFFDVKDKLCSYLNLEDKDIEQQMKEKYNIDNEAINIMLGIRIGTDGGFKYSKFTKQSYKQIIDGIINSNINNNKPINLYVLSDIENFSFMIDESDKYKIIYVNDDDISQIYVGLMCNYFILSDSTFHWWIAFLKWSKDASTSVYCFNNTDTTNRCLLNTTLKAEWKCVDLIPNENFVFMKYVDHFGSDMFKINGSIPILMDRAEKEKDCVAFNTLGFFKNDINMDNLKTSPYFTNNDGIYVKKEYYDKWNDTKKPTQLDVKIDVKEGLELPVAEGAGERWNSGDDCRRSYSLKEIAEYFVLDKCDKYLHNFIPIYADLLDAKRDNIRNFFEIGIGSGNNMSHVSKYNYKTGNSLRAWKEYCKNANIYGIDIIEECIFEEPRIKTHICNQNDSEQLKKLMDNLDVKMDVILDDGSHVTEHQVVSFMTLEKYLVDDGIYIIENIIIHNYQTWKNLSVFSDDYRSYINRKYDVFCYDQSSSKSNISDYICVFKKKRKMTRVKMLCNWCSSEQLCKEWSNMCDDPEKFQWNNNLELTWSERKEDIDYYVIVNSPPANSYFDPVKTIVFQMEPWVHDNNHHWGVKTWGKWSAPSPAEFLAVRGRKSPYHNNAFWQLELTYNQLLNLKITEKKQHMISSICSSKYFDEGHIARIDLLKYIEQKNDPNVQIDIYNQDNVHNFKNFKGPVSPYVDKSKGMMPYKYYFMMENNYEENFITEKIWEPILCESLVFYYGCPNITDYIDSRAFVLLDVNDFEKSYQIIKQAIEEDWHTQRIDVIRKEKQKILSNLAFFPTIEKIIMNNIENPYSKLYNTYFQIPSTTSTEFPRKTSAIASVFLQEYNNKNYNNLLKFLHNYHSSAWLGHLKFAMWLVNKYKPKVTLELGVDYGHSAFAFASEGIGNVYGIDCFEGDIHAGHRDTLQTLNDTKKYLLDNQLIVRDNLFPIKGYFDEIYKSFNHTVDILHIDGLHTYEAVSNDFNTWINKTHDNSIILMHDVISFRDSVGKFFDEIPYPKTFFSHSAGLGVVSKNQSIIDDINNIWLNNNNPKKYCFIHSCHLKEVGINILNELISNLINSNSIQYFEKIFVVNIGEKIDQNDFHHNKIKIINYSDDVNLFEIPTINLIRTFCEYNDNCEILYLHTKGVTCPNSKNVSDWKNMMTYFLVNKCTECFELLKKYDTVGCNYTEAPHKHYSGNFWWANSSYIKRLSKIPCDSKRHDAEWWILSNDTVTPSTVVSGVPSLTGAFGYGSLHTICEIHHSGINHYLTEYSSEKYSTIVPNSFD